MRRNQFVPALVAVALGAIAVALLIGEGLASLPLAVVLVFPMVLVVTMDCVHDGATGRRGADAHDHAQEDQPVAAGRQQVRDEPATTQLVHSTAADRALGHDNLR